MKTKINSSKKTLLACFCALIMAMACVMGALAPQNAVAEVTAPAQSKVLEKASIAQKLEVRGIENGMTFSDKPNENWVYSAIADPYLWDTKVSDPTMPKFEDDPKNDFWIMNHKEDNKYYIKSTFLHLPTMDIKKMIAAKDSYSSGFFIQFTINDMLYSFNNNQYLRSDNGDNHPFDPHIQFGLESKRIDNPDHTTTWEGNDCNFDIYKNRIEFNLDGNINMDYATIETQKIRSFAITRLKVGEELLIGGYAEDPKADPTVGKIAPRIKVGGIEKGITFLPNSDTETAMWIYTDIVEPFLAPGMSPTETESLENNIKCHTLCYGAIIENRKLIGGTIQNYPWNFNKLKQEVDIVSITVEINGKSYIFDKYYNKQVSSMGFSSEIYCDELGAPANYESDGSEYSYFDFNTYMNTVDFVLAETATFDPTTINSIIITEMIINGELLVGGYKEPVAPIIPEEPTPTPEQKPDRFPTWTKFKTDFYNFFHWFEVAWYEIKNFFAVSVPNFFTISVPDFFTKLGDNIGFLFTMKYSKFYW